MPITIDSNFTLDKDLAELEQKLEKVCHHVFRGVLSVKKSTTWVPVSGFNCLNSDGTVDGQPADVLALKVIELADTYISEHGGGNFKAEFFAQDKKKREEVEVAQHQFKRGLDDQSSTVARESELLAMSNLLRDHMKDMHVMHKDLFNASRDSIIAYVGLQKETAEVMKAGNQNMEHLVSLAELKYSHERDTAEAEADADTRKVGIELLQNVAMAWILHQSGAAKPTPGKEQIPGHLDGLMKTLTPEECDKLKVVFGEDAWILLTKAAESSTDQEAQALLMKLKELWKATPKDEGQKLLAKAGEILGQARFMQLMHVLKMAKIV